MRNKANKELLINEFVLLLKWYETLESNPEEIRKFILRVRNITKVHVIDQNRKVGFNNSDEIYLHAITIIKSFYSSPFQMPIQFLN